MKRRPLHLPQPQKVEEQKEKEKSQENIKEQIEAEMRLSSMMLIS